ncbi:MULTISPECIES: LysR family transcriptional regulator [unclassified Streptomyces]|uniref:LysR family transcriptional regulator n=1 Tax=unclassified Streptomyces TaxID=2593676 RepID=UPI000A5D8605|nr:MULTISPECIES: LysR family transcriptional regulator [unclassified Streptomyces]
MSDDGAARPGPADEAYGPPSPCVDMRLLPALDALLQESSVTGAAERLAVSTPAMSRTLSKLRRALGDPVLVRAGRGLVPTPRALELRARVHALVREAEALLAPRPATDLAEVRRTLTVVADDAYAAVLAPALTARARAQVPHARLRFLAESNERTAPLREGAVDIEVGVIDEPSPELHIEPLFEDRFMGVARTGHPLLAGGPVTPEQYARAPHISVSRRGRMGGPIDASLAAAGLHRQVVASVPNYASALLMLPLTDLVAAMPLSLATSAEAPFGIEVFELPVRTDPISICQAWHPRHEAEPVHVWLREAVRAVLADPAPGPGPGPAGAGSGAAGAGR